MIELSTYRSHVVMNCVGEVARKGANRTGLDQDRGSRLVSSTSLRKSEKFLGHLRKNEHLFGILLHGVRGLMFIEV